mmetsp:Transcript_3804/g.4378  ORF Transcript_3804/g.4378 Transcript_3804/m.4378 type:complete len:104 (-) Transcript_3804:555-866(-)
MKHCIRLLLLSLLFCYAFDNIDEISIVIKFKEFFVAILSETRLDQTAQDDLDAMHCFFVHDWVHFMTHVSDVFGCGGEAVAHPHISQDQRLRWVLTPLSDTLF